VRNLFIPISVGLLCTSYTIIPSSKKVNSKISAVTEFHPVIEDSCFDNPEEAETVYNTINLQHYGLSREAFEYSWKGYQKLVERKTITRSDYLTICDFSQSSKQKRLYIINVPDKKLIINTYVAHGKNSGEEFATKFSNIPESLQSSLGFYITAGTYMNQHGLSLRLEGVDPGYNDKALDRGIVMHGAEYVDESREKAGIFMGRSWGCPAVPQKESANIIITIKNGTCLFIYHPSRNYLLGSKILNG
jgi:L,D-transpeptidase catalytic domain